MKPVDTELGPLRNQGVSETAATVGNRLFGNSGVMRYRVICHGPGGYNATVVEAATGDEAATKGLAKFPGTRVTNVAPAGDDVVLSDQVEA